MRKSHITNQSLVSTIQELKKVSSTHKANIWKRVANDLEKPTRKRRIVNISRINRYTKDNSNVVVPGKVLSSGVLDHKVIVAAYAFSREAESKIKGANGECVSLLDMAEKNPKGKGLRIIG